MNSFHNFAWSQAYFQQNNKQTNKYWLPHYFLGTHFISGKQYEKTGAASRRSKTGKLIFTRFFLRARHYFFSFNSQSSEGPLHSIITTIKRINFLLNRKLLYIILWWPSWQSRFSNSSTWTMKTMEFFGQLRNDRKSEV